MIRVNEIAFTAYAVTDLARARAFYEGVLGLKPGFLGKPEAEAHWVEYEIGPHTLGLGCAPDWKPSPDGGSVALEVEDFDAAIEHLRAAGVKFRIEPFQSPICRAAMIFDPDGNTLAIHKRNA
jgi:predicted enzyme related to lactoylglutathione lyase